MEGKALASDEIQVCVLICVAISGALVGTFLVLRRMTMLANALSHTLLIGIISAYLLMRGLSKGEEALSLPTLIIASLMAGLLTTFLTQFLTYIIKLQEDASIGLVFSILFALAIVLISTSARNLPIGTDLVMGNVDALKVQDLRGISLILVMHLALFLFLFQGFKVTTFDPQLARALGFSPLFFNYLLMIQTSATAIGGFRAVGMLMILAFLIIPVLIARFLTHSLLKLMGWAVGIGIAASALGVALSRHILTIYRVGLSTGGIVVILLGVAYLAILIFTKIAEWIARNQLRAH
ncbi:MAG: metal ABC transporter permease [Chlamydiales bacterium]